MQPDVNDISYLWDMYNAGMEIAEFIAGKDFNDFARNKILRYAVERQIMVIGEAAKHISQAFKDTHHEIPWKSIVAQRNVIAHEYGEILIERIWVVSTESIPKLIRYLKPFIPNDLRGKE